MNDDFIGADGKPRCRWCGAAPAFLLYHDTEWGFPVWDEHRLFEKLSLESFQARLSRRTILAKRQHFRAAFHAFDFNKVALFTEHDVDQERGGARAKTCPLILPFIGPAVDSSHRVFIAAGIPTSSCLFTQLS